MRKSILLLASMALALVLVSGVFLAGFQGQAQALASHPPDAVLKQENRVLQDGRLISYCWINRCVDGVSRYPSAVEAKADSRLHIRLSENQRPESFSLRSNQSADPFGLSQRLDTTLRRVERDGKTVAWDVYFRLNNPGRHYYLDAFGTWKHNGGRVHGDAYWQFHVKTSP